MSLLFSNRKFKYDKQSASTTQLEIDTKLKHFMIIVSADKSGLIFLELFTFCLMNRYKKIGNLNLGLERGVRGGKFIDTRKLN